MLHWVRSVYYTDPAHYLKAVGRDVDDPDRDLPNMRKRPSGKEKPARARLDAVANQLVNPFPWVNRRPTTNFS